MRLPNGLNDYEINVRKTHPNLYWILMSLAAMSIGLGINFIFLKPTFPIWHAPNEIWGAIFLVLGVARFVTLNIYRRLRWVRATMAFSMAYMAFMAAGTADPSIHGTASFQLPVIYTGMVLIQWPLLFEPFWNPETAK